jgi:hypothetical protein
MAAPAVVWLHTTVSCIADLANLSMTVQQMMRVCVCVLLLVTQWSENGKGPAFLGAYSGRAELGIRPSLVLGLCGLGYGCGHTAFVCVPLLLILERMCVSQVASAVAGYLRHEAVVVPLSVYDALRVCWKSIYSHAGVSSVCALTSVCLPEPVGGFIAQASVKHQLQLDERCLLLYGHQAANLLQVLL